MILPYSYKVERLDYLEVDRNNFTATIGAGATLKELIEAAGENSLSFSLNPGMRTSKSAVSSTSI